MNKRYNCCIPIALFFILGLCYSYYTPLWTPPDEERHFTYGEYIAQKHTLPSYTSAPEGNSVHMAYHPPLYYMIGSLFSHEDQRLLKEEISVNDGPGYRLLTLPKKETEFPYAGKARTAYLLRFLSLMLGGITISLIYSIALMFFPKDQLFASVTAIFVATIPQFLHVSASISNENLSTTLSAAYLLLLLYYLRDPARLRWQVGSGILLGLCLLSKTSTVFYLPVTTLFILWLCLRDKRNPILPLFFILGTAIVVSGWWFLRNWLMFNDPTFVKTYDTLNSFHLRGVPLSLGYVTTVIEKTFTTFFGFFGALEFSLPDFHFAIYGVIILLSIVGLCLLWAKKALSSLQVNMLGLFLLVILVETGMYAYINIKYTGFYLGRYLYMVIAPIAMILMMGFRSLLPLRWRNPSLVVLSFVLIILNLNVLFRILKPAYAEPRLALVVDQPMFCCFKPAINDTTTISQTFVSPSNKLCAIRAMFSCESKRAHGDIVFVLKETGEQGKIICQMHYPVKNIQGIDRCFFIFPPILDSRGKEYQVSFSAPSVSPGAGVSLWYDAKDRYPAGRMFVNGEPTDGDLYFQAYCFTGEHPETDWEGKREIIIDQMYVSVRELQLYAEMSKEFREKTIIHKKLERTERALQGGGSP